MSSSLPNFAEVNDHLATGAQPTPEGISQLKELGFKAILNLSPISTPNYLEIEGALAAELELEYVHSPVDCSNLKMSHYDSFRLFVTAFHGKKTFVHCGGNIKSSALMHPYLVKELGMDEKKSLGMLMDIHVPEAKWFDLYEKIGLSLVDKESLEN